MVWLIPPPYLRYAAAVLLVVGALAWDLRPEPVVDHPFLRVAVAAGADLDPGAIEWRSIPAGALPNVMVEGRAAIDLPAGTALLPGMISTGPVIPEGWFALELSVPAAARPGQLIRLVIDESTFTDGLVISQAQSNSTFLTEGSAALIAVPEPAAAIVADAARRSSVTVLLGG